jgi:hypothetical protein
VSLGVEGGLCRFLEMRLTSQVLEKGGGIRGVFGIGWGMPYTMLQTCVCRPPQPAGRPMARRRQAAVQRAFDFSR